MKDHHSIIKVDRISEQEYTKPAFSEMQVKRMKNFQLSYNRHQGAYPVTKLPYYDYQTYPSYFYQDQDWTQKMRTIQKPKKRLVALILLFLILFILRVRSVQKHDVKVRHEQRAMQNKELEEIKVEVQVRVEGLKNLDFNEVPLSTFRGRFVVLWADHNFALFKQVVNSLEKKRFAFPLITVIFAVPLQKENITDSEKLDTFRDRLKFEKNTLSEKWKREFEVMLIDLEKNSGKGLMEGEDKLNLRRGYYYIIAPDGGVVDCANIFSFQHQKNLLKRISAKISSAISKRGFKVQE